MISTYRRVCVSVRRMAALVCGFIVVQQLSAALPEGWADADIGTVSVAGTATEDPASGILTLQGSGAGDIAGTSDNFHYAYRQLSGDGEIIARIDSLTNTNAAAKAGVMIRESLNANSRHALMMVTSTQGAGLKWRSATGGSSSQVTVSGAAPKWLKLERHGNMVTGYESADGVSWNVVQRVAVAMTNDVLVGLVACSKSSGLTTVTASQLQVQTLATELALPWPWTEVNVGSPTDAGVAFNDDGAYVLSNLGADITGTADKMKYVTQPLIGDGTITVKIDSVTSADNSTRFGLMMRDGLAPGSREVLLGLTTAKSVVFMSRRDASGTLTSRATSVTVAVPAWLKLQRTGDVFTAWRSDDGLNWTQHGTETLALGRTVYAGLAYSNRSTSTWAIGVGGSLGLVSSQDADGNGLDDAWEIQHFGATGVDPLADPDGDGLNNGQEWELGNDPLVFNLEGQRPLLELVSGNGQSGPAGSTLAQPMVVRVKDSISENAVSNIPVMLRVVSGEGRLGSQPPGIESLSLYSDANGLVQSPFILSEIGGLNVVGASVGGREQASVVSFNLRSLIGEASLRFDVDPIGSHALPPRVSYAQGTFTSESATTFYLTGTADTGTYAWAELTGDGYILARVEHLDAADTSAQAGVMFRESLDQNALHVSMLQTGGKGAVFQWRETVGGTTKVGSYQTDQTGPLWLLVRRSGDTFTGFYSTDGQTWILKGTRVQAMSATLKVGIVHATKTSVYNHATFSGLRMGGFDQAPWQVVDVGAPKATAVDDISDEAIVMRAGGTNIGGTSDTFHFICQPMVGDGRIMVNLASLQATSPSAKSGLMIRESLNAGARNVSLLLSPGTGLTMFARKTTSGSTTTIGTSLPNAVAPQWLRVDRFGKVVSAYVSSDGQSWTLLGSLQMAFDGTPLIGLAGGNYDYTAHSLALFAQPALQAGEGALGWNASYYNGNAFGQWILNQRDADLDFNWASGQAPAPGVSADAFSARWEGDVIPAYDEVYTFTTRSQGSVRLSINGQLVIDQWTPHMSGEGSVSVALHAGQAARVLVEYANLQGQDGLLQLRWSSASQAESALPFTAVRPIDADDDGLPDAWETAHGLNPNDSADATEDSDHDGLTNLQEYQYGGDPHATNDRLSGIVSMDTWTSLSGLTVRDLTQSSRFPGTPSSRSILTTLDAPQNSAENYGRRIRGYLLPSVSGEYRFHIAANDNAELWVSSDDSPFTRVKIAQVRLKNTVAYQDFSDEVEQHSWPIALEAGHYYYFEVLHKENNGSDHLSVAWTRPGQTTPEIITSANLANYAGRADDQNDNGLPDAWEAAQGLGDPQLDPVAVGAYGDADGDRLVNLLEYQQGTDPLAGDSDGDTHDDFLETLVGYDPLTPSDLGLAPWQFADVGHVNTDSLAIAANSGADSFKMAGTGSGLTLHKADGFRYLYQEVSGDFEFTTRIVRPVTSATGWAGVSIRESLDSHAASMSLMQSVDGLIRTFVRPSLTDEIVELPSYTPGFASEQASLNGYWFRIRRTGDVVRIYYSLEGRNWVQSASRDLPLPETCVVGMAISHDMGLGVGTFYTELPVREFKDVRMDTDFVAPDALDTVPADATATPVAIINGNAGVTVYGQWASDADGIVSQTFTGTLDYAFTVPADGLYRLSFLANSPSNPTSSNLFPLQISVDGQVIGRVDLFMEVGQDGLARIVTPWLRVGAHTVRVFYDNTLSYHPLRIRSLTVEALGGPDANNDGMADWIADRLISLNTIDTDSQLYVSPASLDGKARYRAMFTLTAGGQPVETHPAPGFGWYADVPLAETAPVQVTGDFENSGSVQSVLLTWSPLNLLDLPVEYALTRTMRVRLGDSLRLTAYASGATGGSASVEIASPDNTTVGLALTDPIGQPLARVFTAPGIYTVTATYVDAESNQTVSDPFTVEVIEAAFAADPTVGLNNYPVVWDNPQIPSSVLIEVDQGVLLFAKGSLPAGGTSYSVSSGNVDDSYVVARLGESGPIFGHATIHTLRAATLPDTAMDVLQVYPDGSQLIGVPIVINHLTDDTRVEVEIFVQGVTFEDGTTVKTLTKADFDEYGRVYLKFIYPQGTDGSICHRVHIYEGSTYLGTF